MGSDRLGENNYRNDYMDIAKGILIILVVIGHSGFKYSKYIYWFHMPAFFFISGYFFKEINGYKQFVTFTKRKVIKTIYPYIISLIIITILNYYIYPFNITSKYVKDLLYGGRLLQGSYGVFWFVTCLLITQIIFGALNTITKSKKLTFVTIFILYLLAHIESYYICVKNHSLNVPLNFDVALFSLLFFGLGYYSKNLLIKTFSLDKIKILLITIFTNTLCIFLIYLDYSKKFSYVLDLKYVRYNHVILDIIIPMLFITAIILDSYFIRQIKILQSIGQNSISIMYIHIPINCYLRKYCTYNWFIFSIIGIAIPILISSIHKKFANTRKQYLNCNNNIN
ncbi:acyltransferase family protein [uncultured Clostridium sp.]|uniref:acyltransferase family protein n=1 Tax=uncultured Clostridium sp. TaxID=59620 RepID=UPI00321676A7